MPNQERITASDLAKRYGCTKRTIEKWIAKGWLPPRVRVPGKRAPFWYQHLIDQWERDRGICPVSVVHAEAILIGEYDKRETELGGYG